MAGNKQLPYEIFTGHSDEVVMQILSCKIFQQQQNQQLLHQQQEAPFKSSTPISLTAPEERKKDSPGSPNRSNNKKENGFAVNSLTIFQQAQNESQATTSDTIKKFQEENLDIKILLACLISGMSFCPF